MPYILCIADFITYGYESAEIASLIDKALFDYIYNRINEGMADDNDSRGISTLREVRDAFANIKVLHDNE